MIGETAASYWAYLATQDTVWHRGGDTSGFYTEIRHHPSNGFTPNNTVWVGWRFNREKCQYKPITMSHI